MAYSARSRSADIRIGTVLGITTSDRGVKMANLVDSDTASPFEIPLSAPGGVYPRPGDTWMLTKDFGFWSFKQCIGMPSRDASPERTVRAVIDTLAERGLISPSFGGGSDPEAPHFAKIGQIRWFAYTPDPYWWPEADGASVSRREYLELGEQIAPGSSPTFPLPLVPTLGEATPFVCAR
jgi:hypothetical protein